MLAVPCVSTAAAEPTGGLPPVNDERAPDVVQMMRDGKKVTSAEAQAVARRVSHPLAAVSGCHCVHCFCCSNALPVSCACNCYDSTDTVYACNLLPPVPCITHDVGRGAERGRIFFHQMCRQDDFAPTDRCAVLMPIDESTLGFWLLRRSDPCCYCYRKI